MSADVGAQSDENDGMVHTEDAKAGVAVGTVVRSASGTIACRYNSTLAVLFGEDRPVAWSMLSLPLQVLWDPRTPPGART